MEQETQDTTASDDVAQAPQPAAAPTRPAEGDEVLFFQSSPSGHNPVSACITKVWGPGCVNLDNGCDSVLMWGPGMDVPSGYFCFYADHSPYIVSFYADQQHVHAPMPADLTREQAMVLRDERTANPDPAGNPQSDNVVDHETEHAAGAVVAAPVTAQTPPPVVMQQVNPLHAPFLNHLPIVRLAQAQALDEIEPFAIVLWRHQGTLPGEITHFADTDDRVMRVVVDTDGNLRKQQAPVYGE